MNIQRALSHAQALGLPRLEAQMLLLHSLGQSVHARAWLITHAGDALSDPQAAAFDALVQRRLRHEPVAYITGHKEFFGLDLADTPTPRVLDLGTGSGAIALAIQSARPDAQVLAVDASAEALAVAAANAHRLGLAVEFYQGSWFSGWQAWKACDAQFDVIVSNPPYVAHNDPHLAALRFEPLSALASGADGLDDLRHITAQALPHLTPGGWLLLEHGFDQAQAVQELLGNQGFTAVQSRPDLAGILRCSGGQSPKVK